MKTDVLLQTNWEFWSIVAFFIFIAVFVGVLVWSFRPGSNKTYRDMSLLPFKELKKKKKVQ